MIENKHALDRNIVLISSKLCFCNCQRLIRHLYACVNRYFVTRDEQYSLNLDFTFFRVNCCVLVLKDLLNDSLSMFMLMVLIVGYVVLIYELKSYCGWF